MTWVGLLTLCLAGSACGGTEIQAGSADGSAHPDGTTTVPEGGMGPDGSTTGPDATQGPDVGAVKDAGPGGIPCGAGMCVPETQECCIVETPVCMAKGTCDGGIAVACSSPTSCPAAEPVCCASFGGSGASVACTGMGDCHGLELCESDMDCPDMRMCEPGPDGFKYCQRHRPDGGFHPPDGGFVPDTGSGG
jgi:hypothetical protein